VTFVIIIHNNFTKIKTRRIETFFVEEDFLICIVGTGGGVQLDPLGTAATNRPIVPGPGDDGEIGGMIGRGNRNTRRKPAPVPLCPP
jgi:hypothetical protein